MKRCVKLIFKLLLFVLHLKQHFPIVCPRSQRLLGLSCLFYPQDRFLTFVIVLFHRDWLASALFFPLCLLYGWHILGTSLCLGSWFKYLKLIENGNCVPEYIRLIAYLSILMACDVYLPLVVLLDQLNAVTALL
uniref:Uncharacterized protein n=1 Tax=Opuntia streptacantha TaxID=393608 RepID=A0A7C8ZLC1_OPUST